MKNIKELTEKMMRLNGIDHVKLTSISWTDLYRIKA
jgi:metal-responsive CopG/Arc/MetJ family transcriptional regulator